MDDVKENDKGGCAAFKGRFVMINGRPYPMSHYYQKQTDELKEQERRRYDPRNWKIIKYSEQRAIYNESRWKENQKILDDPERNPFWKTMYMGVGIPWYMLKVDLYEFFLHHYAWEKKKYDDEKQ